MVLPSICDQRSFSFVCRWEFPQKVWGPEQRSNIHKSVLYCDPTRKQNLLECERQRDLITQVLGKLGSWAGPWAIRGSHYHPQAIETERKSDQGDPGSPWRSWIHKGGTTAMGDSMQSSAGGEKYPSCSLLPSPPIFHQCLPLAEPCWKAQTHRLGNAAFRGHTEQSRESGGTDLRTNRPMTCMVF